MINERRLLSVAGTSAQRAVQAGIGLFFVAVGMSVVLLPLIADGYLLRVIGEENECTISGDIPPGSLPPELQECLAQGSWSDLGGFGPARFIGLLGLPFALLGLYLTLRALRAGAWLQANTLGVRGAFRTRTVDLSRAEVTVGAMTPPGPATRSLPTLVARDPGTGRRITLPLHSPNLAPLPPAELRALADAMTTGRTDGDADVQTIARQLRTMAENPLRL